MKGHSTGVSVCTQHKLLGNPERQLVVCCLNDELDEHHLATCHIHQHLDVDLQNVLTWKEGSQIFSRQHHASWERPVESVRIQVLLILDDAGKLAFEDQAKGDGVGATDTKANLVLAVRENRGLAILLVRPLSEHLWALASW